MKLRLWVAVFVCINLPCLVSAASFEGLGVLPDATFSIANDISPDGHVAVGASGGVPNRPYYWTHSSGMKELPGLLGFGSGGTAHSSSYDGSVIVGSSESSVGNEAYYWTQSEGTVGLGYLDEDGSLSYAEGVSADGLTIVGRSVSANRTEAFMWTADNGMVGLGSLGGSNFRSGALATTVDGSVIVGNSASPLQDEEAFIWTQANGMQGLGALGATAEDNPKSIAYDITPDGSYVVGWSTSSLYSQEAYRWSVQTEMVGLGVLPGFNTSIAHAVSADGSRVVGFLGGLPSPADWRAFLWDKINGMRTLKDVLINDFNLDLTGWELTVASGISWDGLRIAGRGINPDGLTEAWVADLSSVPAPPTFTCLGDSFESPFNEIITLKNKVKRAIPVKMPLVDADGNLITESDISTPPVVNVSHTPGVEADYGNNPDLVPPGLADEGSEFRFEYPYWVINLATKQFTSAGTYEVVAIAGDDSYVIDASSCSGTFVRLP